MVWSMRINGESTPLPQGAQTLKRDGLSCFDEKKIPILEATQELLQFSRGVTKIQCSFVIGRAASCDMACSDPAVSSTHCILFCEGPNLTVEDRSTNGTYVNGFRLPRRQSIKVVSGDKLGLVKGAAEYLLEFADETSEVPRKLRKLSVLGDGEGLKVSASQVLAATLRRSQDVSLTYRDTELDSDVKDIPMKDADTRSEVTRIEGDLLQADTSREPSIASPPAPASPAPESHCRSSPSKPSKPSKLWQCDTPLDLDADAASLPGSYLEADAAPEPRGRKRRLERAPSRPGHLSGAALLQWLKRRRCDRQGDGLQDVEKFSSRSGDRRKAEQHLKQQVHFFKDLKVELDEITLLSPPEMITSLRCASRKKHKSCMVAQSSEGFVTLLSSTRLVSTPAVAAQATDQWDAIHKSVVTEAAKAFTRSKVMCSRVANISFPWKTHEMLQEALDWECALQMLQDRCDLEAGRRVLMRCGGAHPKAGLFEDAPQGSSEATTAAAAVLQGCLPALATGNEFRAATFLNTSGLSQVLRMARPGVLGTWHPIQVSRVGGFRDVLHCLWSARDIGLGVSGRFVGRMTQAALTHRAFGVAGGQEHCQCSCGQWLTKGKLKGHSCDKDVGKPHEKHDASSNLKLFWQSRGVLAFRVSFKHHSNPPAVDLTLEAALESATKSILWSDFWEAAHVACSWRLSGESTPRHPSEMTLKPPCCEAVPAPPASHSLTPQQLLLLGWMRAQETREGYSSRQVIREDLCEAGTDLYLELLVERDFREKGGLIFSHAQAAGSSIAHVAPLLALLQREIPAPPPHRRRGQELRVDASRCLLDAPGTLVLAQGHSLPCWKAALEQSGVKVLCIQNQKRMRSLTVADILAADFILASLQLFSTEGYQRHFDALAKPGLELWCPADPELEADPQPVEPPSSAPALSCGDVVQLHSLERQAELNGRKGRLLEWQSSSGRWSCLLQPEKGKRREVKQVLVNVRPCNVKAVQRGEGKRSAFSQKQRRPAGESQAKASKYYAELRAREDYMARRQVDLERQTVRLLQQAATESASVGKAIDLANSGAVLEMFRFNRLVLDDCHDMVRDLEQLLGAGSAFTNLSHYLTKVSPLYAVHAITANSRWCLSDSECLKSAGHHVVAPFASLLGIQVAWGDASEAQRFLDCWGVAVEDPIVAGMFGGLSRCLGQGVRRTAGSFARQALRTPVAFEAMPKTFNAPMMRPFSVLGTNYMRFINQQTPSVPKPVVEPLKAIQNANVVAKDTGLPIGISFVVLHYQSIFIGVMRCLFQAFRPLLILFIFGQIIKAVFFIAGAPIWMSFYSIWLFEVTYGLAQCAISFIFISFFYNNLSFARIRPALRQMLRQQKDIARGWVKGQAGPSSTSSALDQGYRQTVQRHSEKQAVLIGLGLTGVNVILLFHNLDAFEARSVVYHQAPLVFNATAPPKSTSKAQPNKPKLRGSREVLQPTPVPRAPRHIDDFQDVTAVPSTSESEAAVPVTPEQVPDVADLIAFALAQNTTQMVKFWSPSWSLSSLTLSRGQQLPYDDRYSGVNYTFGEYLGHDNVVFVSPCGAKELHQMDFPFGDFLKEKAAFMHMQCPAAEVAENMLAKDVVAYVNFRESGYYGHAIDNILPRIFAVLPGVVQSGHKMVLVLPPLGKRSLSENTKLLCEALGIEVRLRVPIYPHRTMGLSGVSSWSREMRQTFQRAVWASPLLMGAEVPRCDPWTIPPWRPDAESRLESGVTCPCRFGPGIFLGRHATRNSRPVQGAEYLEAEFQAQGFEVVTDAATVPLQQLARKIYRSCSLVGFAGTAMVNLIFLPPQAAVADLNPYLIYANSWLWAHALNYCFCQVQPPRKLDQHEASKWAALILGNQMEETPRFAFNLLGFSGVEEVVHQLQFSRKERVVYLFRCLERADPDLKKPRQRAQHVRSLLQLCCEPTDVEELAKDSPGVLEHHMAAVAEVWAQKCLKDADVTLAEEEYTDFELRLQVFKSLASRDTQNLQGLEREVLLAVGHSSTEQLQTLADDACGRTRTPLDVQLRRLAQAALEGAPGVESLGKRPGTHSVNCQVGDEIQEVAASLRLAEQRAQKAQEKTTRKWRLLQVLLEAADLPSPDASASPLALCNSCGAQTARLMACGHVACQGHETCNCEGKELADSSVCSKIDGMVRTIQKVLSENPKVQCLIFSQWTSTLRKLEDALHAQNLESIMPGSTKRRRGRTAVKSIVLLTTDFLCSEKLGRQDRQEHAALDEHAVTRHVFLANTFYTAPAFTADVLEQRIIDFAKTSQLGVASTAILHRFVMSDTIEATGELISAQETGHEA
eukprot:s1049_g13.t1